MRCDHDLLLDHLDGELDGARAVEMDEHLAGCESCRAEAEAYDRDLGLVQDALAATDDDSLTDAELSALLSAPELCDAPARPHRLFGLPLRPPRTAAVLALAAAVLLALLLNVPPSEEVSTTSLPPTAVAKADERVEIRMASGNPSIQVIWVMSKDVQF
ncbi:MAG: zf-HC2 domain-containing protein [Myxococcota bacterium]|jgi:anti-sigma factor RsiW|nr:zf-HC2 domain-containing protein [Myxococcota bacterium]